MTQERLFTRSAALRFARGFALPFGALALTAACKTDPPAAPAEQSLAKPRSAQIDLSPKPTPTAPSLPPDNATPPPALPPAPDPAAGDPGDPAERARRLRRPPIDTDGDGVVSPDERNAAMAERTANMHARLDRDKDGKLTSAELAMVPSRLHFDNPDALDTDRDGDISAEELATALQQRREARMRERAGQPQGPGAQGAPAGDPSAPR